MIPSNTFYIGVFGLSFTKLFGTKFDHIYAAGLGFGPRSPAPKAGVTTVTPSRNEKPTLNIIPEKACF